MGNSFFSDTHTYAPFSNEERLIHALHLVQLGLWTYDANQHAFHFCDETFRIFGMGKLEGMVPFELVLEHVHLQDRSVFVGAFLDANRQFLDLRFRIFSNKESERFVHCVAEVAPMPEDASLIYGTFRDITEDVRLRTDLKHHRESLLQAVRMAGLGHWEVNMATKRVLFSEEMCHIYGIPDSGLELDALEAARFTHPDDVMHVNDRIQQFLDVKENYEDEYRVIRPDGSVRFVHVLGEAEVDAYGNICAVRGTAQDITERRRQAELLEQSQQQYNSLMQYNPDGICAVDLSGRLMGSNPAYQRILGYTEEDLSQMTFLDILIPEDIPFASEIVRSALNGEVHADIEAVLKHKSGHRVNVLCTNIPIVVNGETIGIYAIIKDVTAQRKAEAQFHSIFDSAKDAIIFMDDTGTILSWNQGAEGLFGYTSMERIGQKLLVENHFREADGRIPPAHKLQEDIDQTVELTAVHKDGRQTPVDVAITSFGNGGEVAYVAIIHDVSDRKDSERLLLKSEKLSAVGQLAAGVAHEIRNPLTALKGFTQLLQYRARGNRKRYYDIMEAELNRIETILNELLVLAKPQAIHMKQVDLRFILQEVITLLNAQAVMHSVNILPLFDELPALVECEGNQLKQVFVNVIKNAIEAMPQGGNLLISLSAKDNRVSIRFVDEGQGIAEDRIPKLGEPFYTTKEKGTGLGLMVSHKIIHSHKGTIEIKSKINEGTTVEILLPTSASEDLS